jgi:hypothetical protein
MIKRLTIAVAALALAAAAGTARAERICQWTGSDWACGDGKMFTEHFSEAQGPDMVVRPAPAPQLPAGQYLPDVYGRRAR